MRLSPFVYRQGDRMRRMYAVRRDETAYNEVLYDVIFINIHEIVAIA
jgi:hypothetical protein